MLMIEVKQKVLQVLFTKHDDSLESVRPYEVKVNHTSTVMTGIAYQPLQGSSRAPRDRIGIHTYIPKKTYS